MVMFVVVPAEEFCRPDLGIGLTAKPFRIVRSIFQGLKLRFGKWIVVGDMWVGVGFGHTQICHEQGHRFGCHRAAAIGMDCEFTGLNVLANTGGGD